PSFVRADRTAHLDAVTPVDLDIALIVHPGNPEHDNPLGLGYPFQYLCLPVTRITVQHRFNRFHHLTYSLMKFLFMRILRLDNRHNLISHRNTPIAVVSEV